MSKKLTRIFASVIVGLLVVSMLLSLVLPFAPARRRRL